MFRHKLLGHVGPLGKNLTFFWVAAVYTGFQTLLIQNLGNSRILQDYEWFSWNSDQNSQNLGKFLEFQSSSPSVCTMRFIRYNSIRTHPFISDRFQIHNILASIRKNRADKSHRVIVALTGFPMSSMRGVWIFSGKAHYTAKIEVMKFYNLGEKF